MAKRIATKYWMKVYETGNGKQERIRGFSLHLRKERQGSSVSVLPEVIILMVS